MSADESGAGALKRRYRMTLDFRVLIRRDRREGCPDG